jgi:primosomal protein N'
MYYRSEMFQRKQLGFPPYAHFGMVKVRGRKEARVQEVAQDLFSRFKDMQSPQGVKIIAVNPGQPLRLRGNFYWQVLVGARSATRLTKFLKLHLKEVRHSGIIVTVDVDPL